MLDMYITIFLFIAGLVLIIKGGDWFVDAASFIAEATGIPKIIIGATIVSVATTLPEQLVSMMAVLNGSNDMGIGNAIGSVSCNIGVAMAISMYFLPSAVHRSDFKKKGSLMIAAAITLLFISFDGVLSHLEAMLLLAELALFIVMNVQGAKQAQTILKRQKKNRPDIKTIVSNLLMFSIGATAIIVGAKLLVDNGQILARALGIPEAVIGLTLIAVGTSLPEIVTTIVSVAKGESGMSVGNIIGANIIDMTLILALCSLMSGNGLMVSKNTILVDIPVSLVLISVAVLPTIWKGRFVQLQGVLLLGIYSAYILLTVVAFG